MNTHRIHRVSKLTGLTKDVIRVWERRYGILQPERGENRYRLYTDEDVALLRYLKSEMDKGASIGDLAALGREALIERIHALPLTETVPLPSFESLIEELIGTLDPLDAVSFERRFNGAVAVIPFEEALYRILIPLQVRVGQLWHDEKIDISVEHYVTKQVQQKIFTAMNQFRVNEAGEKIIVACGPEEEHEIGAQISAYLCRLHGHRVHYLGANVPVDALVSLCKELKPALTLISMTVVPSKEILEQIIETYSDQILPLCPIWVGGQGAEAVKAELQNQGMEVLKDNREMEDRLLKLIK